MPVYLAPGVYVLEEERGPKSIQGVSTNVAAFIGAATDGPPLEPKGIDSFEKFERIYGSVISADFPLGYAVRGFFENGGTYCYIARMSEAKQASLEFKDKNDTKTVFTLKAKSYGKTGEKIKATLTKSENDSLTKDPVQLSYMDGGGVPVEKLLTGDKKLVVDYPLGSKFRFLAGDNVSFNDGGTPDDAKVLSTKLSNGGDEEYVVILDKEVTPPDVSVLPPEKAVLGLGLIDVDSLDSTTKTKVTIPSSNLKYEFKIDDIVYYYKDSEHIDVTDGEGAKIKAVDITTTPGKTILELKSAVTSIPTGKTARIRLLVVSTEVSGTEVKLGDRIEVSNITKGDDLLYTIATDITDISTITPKTTAEAVSIVKAPKYEIELDTAVIPTTPPTTDPKIVIKKILTNEVKIRVQSTLNIFKGSIIHLTSTTAGILDGDGHHDIVVDKTADSITLSLGIPEDIDLDTDKKVDITSVEYTLTLDKNGTKEKFESMGLFVGHPNYFIKTLKGAAMVEFELPESGYPDPEDFANCNSISNILALKAPAVSFVGGVEDSFGKNKDDFMLRASILMDDVADKLERIADISLLAFPGATDVGIQAALVGHCEKMKYRFAILDAPNKSDGKQAEPDIALAARNKIGSDTGHAALYYPWLKIRDDVTAELIEIPPSGYIAGVYARSDNKRGVHKAPANEQIRNIIGLTYPISFAENELLNPAGVNCLRAFPGQGNKVWGARTITKNPSWKYVNVRRLFIFLEYSIQESTSWVVFEPNDNKLWARVRQTITNFLTTVWRDGALMGTTADEAFFVTCDRTTMTQDDIDNGRLICVIGVAPVKPAEFVIFKIAQWTGGAAS